MKYKLVTNGEQFAVQRTHWLFGKHYLSLYSSCWWRLGEGMSTCWGTREQALSRLKLVDKMQIKETEK